MKGLPSFVRRTSEKNGFPLSSRYMMSATTPISKAITVRAPAESTISNARLTNSKPFPPLGVTLVYGEGLNVRDWLYVEDHCRAIALIIHKGKVGEVYNVGGHNEMKNIDIVKLICKELGKPESLITHVEDRKGHDMRYAIDPTKIHNELGWLPETKFEDGIKKTIKWYLENREWWETIISGEYQNYYEKMYGNRAEV